MQENGGVIKVLENVYAESVYYCMGDEEGRVYSDRLAGCLDVGGLDGGSCRDQACAAKRDSCCDCDLTEEVEPVGVC